jgi:ATP/maltotriose-dependent transcriptional regulator MalT
MGEILFLQGRLTEAEPVLTESLYLARKLEEVDQETPASMANLARLLVLNAEFLIVKGDWDKPAELVKVAVEKARHAWWISPTSAIVCKAFIGALILHARLLKRKGNRAQAATIRSDATKILEGLHRGKGQLDLMKLMVKIELLDVPTDFTRRTASKLRRYNWIGPYLDAWLSEQNVHTTSRVKHSFH